VVVGPPNSSVGSGDPRCALVGALRPQRPHQPHGFDAGRVDHGREYIGAPGSDGGGGGGGGSGRGGGGVFGSGGPYCALVDKVSLRTGGAGNGEAVIS
jgi:hypothetical protein